MIYHYDCDRCGLHRDLQLLPREYSLDHDRTLPIQQRHIWCSVCSDFSVCENLTRDEDAMTYYQEQLQKLRPLRDNPPADLSILESHQRSEVEFAAKWIRDIEQAISEWDEWRSRRQAPSHCLRCGVPVEHVPEDCAPLNHTGCGGTLECRLTLRSSNGPAYVSHLYSVDGALLKAGQKPRILPGLKVEYLPMELFWSESES
jgi:hypothetical protein